MKKLNVYLSSPYMEFKDIREAFLSQIQSRSYIYEINAMELYVAEDGDPLEKCIADVNLCDVYVLILGDAYGSIAKKDHVPSGKSFTYWEYETANKKKSVNPNFERLILLKEGPAAANEDPLLTAWKKEINDPQIQAIYYGKQDEIPQKIINSLDNFTLKRLQSFVQKKDVIRDKIFLCNRAEISLEFTVSIGEDEDPIQFFILSGHEDDLPHYFIKRQEIEYEEREETWKNINIKPSIPESITEFEKAETYIKSAIFNELKWKKFKSPKDVSPQNIIEYMAENDIDYFSISWYIESILWKNDRLKDFIVSFYNKYNSVNPTLKTNKRIFFFGILKYVPGGTVTEEAFNERIKSIQWEHNLPKFSKITKEDIKEWLRSNDIEDIEIRTEELISLYLKEINQREMYYREIETGLQKMLDLYNNH